MKKNEPEDPIICATCRDDIGGPKYTVLSRDGKKALYYHFHCMPTLVKKHVQGNKVEQGPAPV